MDTHHRASHYQKTVQNIQNICHIYAKNFISGFLIPSNLTLTGLHMATLHKQLTYSVEKSHVLT